MQEGGHANLPRLDAVHEFFNELPFLGGVCPGSPRLLVQWWWWLW